MANKEELLARLQEEKPAMEVRDLSFAYGSNQILKDISLMIKEGKITTIMGANGCGKSTLFSLMTKNLNPNRGKVFLHGKNIKNLKLNEFARKVSIVHSAEEMPKEYAEARDESKKAFGDDQIFVEKYLKSPKHIEVQIIGDQYGHVVHLYDRDCSVQRRHQKVVEYAPAFSVPEEVRQQIFEASIRLAKHVGYKNAGTLEFLVDADNNAYFIEMNPRVQVEHTITEMVTGIDIVQTQVLVAEGYSLDSEEIGIGSQEEVTCNGYSIQTRITTEDPMNNFLPDTGKITVYRSGAGNGIRLDGGNAYAGAEITPYYDSLLVKAISHDRTFGRAVDKSIRVLKEIRIRGVKTNIPFLINVLNNETFREGRCYTTFIEETPELFLLPESQDRATKILEFLGNKMVNVQKAVLDKPDFEARTLPKYDTEKKKMLLKKHIRRNR